MVSGLRLLVSGFFLICISHSGLAQLNTTRKAWNQLQDQKWESSFRLLKKELKKDAADLEATFILAWWYLEASNPDFQIDSACVYSKRSEQLYRSLTDRDKERVQRFPIDSVVLTDLQDRIDNAAFIRAKTIGTEEAYLQFIHAFPKANQIPNAIELRDEVSFLEALKENTYQSFLHYITKYPASHRVEEAQERYDKLLFDTKTRDKTIASYRSFIQQYSSSPYVSLAERQILELTTASGKPQAFELYLKEFPTAENAKLVRDILFHLLREEDLPFPKAFATDSLQQVLALEGYWVPFYRNAKYGFMDATGKEMLPAEFSGIEESYKCEPVVTDVLKLPDGYFSRSGKKLAEANVEFNSIGGGFATIKSGSCTQLMHKSGAKIINSCYQSFKLIGNNFIAAYTGSEWHVFTLVGRKLFLEDIEAIEYLEGVVLVTRQGKKIITTLDNLTAVVQGKGLYDELVFDEVRPIRAGELWVRNGSLEGVIGSDLQYKIPLYRHSLQLTPFGLIEKQAGGSVVRGLSSSLENKVWHSVRVHEKWLVLQAEGKFQLYHIPSRMIIPEPFDSVWFDRSLAFVQQSNASRVYLTAVRSLDLQPDSKIKFISARDSVQFFYTESGRKRTVFSITTGEAVFNTEYDVQESIGLELFIVSKGNVKGIVGRNGKEIVKVELDAIIQNANGYFSLLKSKKFGLFDPKSNRQIKPQFERNVNVLDEDHLVAYQTGGYGIIGWDAKPQTEFEFLEIQPWTQSVIWAKRNYQWILINYRTKEILFDKIRDFSFIRNDIAEKLVIIHRDGYYGVLSNTRGQIIAPTFHDILNLGTPETPLYFTEKRVEEAGIYVVIYYDKNGKLIRRQAYEEEEYDRIYCDDN